MLDKKKKDAYIWYSGATDITGMKLAETLGIKHGKNKPIFSKYNLIIGWGTKTDEAVSLGKLQVLNHPDRILVNRNKLHALEAMHKTNVNVANFVDISEILGFKPTEIITAKSASNLVLPLIGRTKHHQGGKGFWICPTITHVKEAINEGAKYFQNMIEIKDEYRLHIFNGKMIYAVKKLKRSKEEYLEAYVRHELDQQKTLAKKNNDPFDEATAILMLTRMAKKTIANGADMIIRSNKKGWKFSHVKTVDEDLKNEAIKALKALKLDFGAIDCCIDVNNKPYIIEINTGPGLEETPFRAYIDAFKEIIANNTVGKKLSKTAKDETLTKTKAVKDEILAKTILMTELVQKADESEAMALKSIFRKMFD